LYEVSGAVPKIFAYHFVDTLVSKNTEAVVFKGKVEQYAISRLGLMNLELLKYLNGAL
jgi:hypothetical protein